MSNTEPSSMGKPVAALPRMEKQPSTRFAAIDGMRGIAALWIALSHFYTSLLPAEEARPWGELLHLIFSHHHLGYVGIYVFFVLSGFVIARNFYGMPMSIGLVGRFALRRSIRLDPTYWTVIVLTLALEAIKNKYALGTAHTWGVKYSVAGLFANLFYLNELLGYPPIVAAGWTLCLEIQFYLVFALLELLYYQTSRRVGANPSWCRAVWFAPFFFWSILVYQLLPVGKAPTVTGLFIEYWYAFFLGVMAWWVSSNICSGKWLAACLLLLSVVVALDPSFSFHAASDPVDYGRPAGACAAMIASVLICLLARWRRLETGLNGPVLQYLGRISYSVYLIHTLVGNRGIRLVLSRSGGAAELDRFEAIALFGIAVAASILAAHCLYVTVERPTHRLSRRISLLRNAGNS